MSTVTILLTFVIILFTLLLVIKTFAHKGLAELFGSGASAKVAKPLQARTARRLDALHAATALSTLNVPGFDVHALKGYKPTRYSLHVNGPWCITFEWHGTDAYAVDLEQYH